MRRTTKDQFRSIRWKPFSYLKDLDLHLCKASWPQHQQKEDRNYGAEYYQHTPSPDLLMSEPLSLTSSVIYY